MTAYYCCVLASYAAITCALSDGSGFGRGSVGAAVSASSLPRRSLTRSLPANNNSRVLVHLPRDPADREPCFSSRAFIESPPDDLCRAARVRKEWGSHANYWAHQPRAGQVTTVPLIFSSNPPSLASHPQRSSQFPAHATLHPTIPARPPSVDGRPGSTASLVSVRRGPVESISLRGDMGACNVGRAFAAKRAEERNAHRTEAHHWTDGRTHTQAAERAQTPRSRLWLRGARHHPTGARFMPGQPNSCLPQTCLTACDPRHQLAFHHSTAKAAAAPRSQTDVLSSKPLTLRLAVERRGQRAKNRNPRCRPVVGPSALRPRMRCNLALCLSLLGLLDQCELEDRSPAWLSMASIVRPLAKSPPNKNLAAVWKGGEKY
ncbi:hypothetical protein B0T14DRAFT_240668 [Immersiella caudata]|uniref:Uncharacterized protein n=1 Tax=Immersiella caudata TaxID=314043 RepID=A0AA39WSU1_9PEZI|nr:hypothetical protein B0T14DRAFT_240668 [Immersiella caudata]